MERPAAEGIEAYVRRLTLVRNSNWDPTSDPIRHAYPDRWEFDFTATDRADVAAHMMTGSDSAQTSLMWESLVGSTALTRTSAGGAGSAQTIAGDSSSSTFLNINTSRVPDIDVRKAINYAYDKGDQIALLGGPSAAHMATTITGPTVPGYLSYDLYPAPPTGDVAAARLLLAGKTVPPLRYCYRPGTAYSDKVAALVKLNLERAGLHIILDPIGSRPHYAPLPPCDLLPVNLFQDYPWNGNVLGQLLRGEASGLLTYAPPEGPVAAELEWIGRMRDLRAAAAAYQALDKQVMRDVVPVVPIMHGRWFSLAGMRIGGAHVSRAWGRVSLQDIYLHP